MPAASNGPRVRESHTVSVDESGERLDKLLATTFPDLSRSRLQRLIAHGNVTVDGAPVKPSSRLAEGQTLRLTMPEPAPTNLEPQPIPLNIVYEDGELVVVDKPAGMPVHPAAGHPDGTLANAVLAHCPDLEGVGDVLRPGIVHRLDKDTSGLVVVAKNDKAHGDLSRQFKDRTVTKVYQALVHGTVSPPAAVIDAPVGRHPGDRKRMAVVSTGRPSTTQYKVTTQYDGYALLQVKPATDGPTRSESIWPLSAIRLSETRSMARLILGLTATSSTRASWDSITQQQAATTNSSPSYLKSSPRCCDH